ncbi:protein rep (plasmid) [Bacillus cereus]|uniref:protein rep n=1 Tax=Bacillus cereus TaxID=1396 RepID=UPI002570CEBD|nr:protein rep [Bacillus cereus]WJE17863.1 protein rep [Bacillus cereus]
MISEFEQKQLDEKLRFSRAERYACQSVARKALPNERVSKCLRLVNNKTNVQVWEHKKTKKAFYNGLLVCGSVWTCPVCAAKISERRRKELQQAFDIHKNNGGYIALLTLTFSHQKTDRLKDTIEKFGQATQKFMSGRAYQNIRDEMGLIGRIRVFEVTFGKNGFHPHAHIALFYKNKVKLKDIKEKMYSLWVKACEKFELTTSHKYGLDLQDGEKAQKYLSKHGTWGLDQELSKSHIKKAKNDSMTPFDFLREYLSGDDEKYLNLFREYAECFKGKRQLQWSQGLKKRFILEEKTDEQVAKEKTEEADLLGLLSYDVWKKILKYENRSYFLDLCEKYDFEKAVSIVSEYKFDKNKKRQVPPKNLT